MKKYTILGDLITPAKVVRCGKGNYPVLSITMHDGIVLQSDRFKKSLASADQSDYKVVEYGKLVIGFPIDEGVLYIQKVAPEGIMSPAYSTWDVDTTRINPDFLELCLHSPQSMQYYKDKLRSTTARRRSIPTADLLALRIRTPDMESQLEAVAVARKVDEMIAIRHAQATLLDQLVKSRFIELFGDPMTNPKGFPCYTVGEVIDFQGGSQPDKKYFEYESTPDNIRLIQIRDYKSDKYITYIPRAMAKRFCTADDIMVGRYGPPIFQILKGIEGSFNVALMKATPKMGNREFARQFLKQDCLLEYLEGLSKRTAGQDGIQMDKLKAYPFPYPPIELQEQFAAFVEQVDKSKLAVQQGLKELEILKKSLMQQYFG